MVSDKSAPPAPFTIIHGHKKARDPRIAAANDEQILHEISRLELDHHDLDLAIISIEERGSGHDRLTLMRLKKKKLAIKDEITRLKNSLEPDIIA